MTSFENDLKKICDKLKVVENDLYTNSNLSDVGQKMENLGLLISSYRKEFEQSLIKLNEV